MPSFLTHWHILIETTRRTQDAGNELGSLIIDAATLLRRAHGWATPPQTTPAGAVWDTGPLPEIDFRFPGSDISSMGYLSHIATDIALNPWINALAAAYPDNNSMAMHTYVELRLDEYLANVYFNHPRYSLSNQPWGHYI